MCTICTDHGVESSRGTWNVWTECWTKGAINASIPWTRVYRPHQRFFFVRKRLFIALIRAGFGDFQSLARIALLACQLDALQ